MKATYIILVSLIVMFLVGISVFYGMHKLQEPRAVIQGITSGHCITLDESKATFEAKQPILKQLFGKYYINYSECS